MSDEKKGMKHDGGKPEVNLIPREALEAAGRAFGYGRQKYAAHNFKQGIAFSRLLAAAMRHLIAFGDNEDNDPESGLCHLDHAMSSVSMLVYMYENKLEFDDRFSKIEGKVNNE